MGSDPDDIGGAMDVVRPRYRRCQLYFRRKSIPAQRGRAYPEGQSPRWSRSRALDSCAEPVPHSAFVVAPHKEARSVNARKQARFGRWLRAWGALIVFGVLCFFIGVGAGSCWTAWDMVR